MKQEDSDSTDTSGTIKIRISKFRKNRCGRHREGVFRVEEGLEMDFTGES